MTRFFRFTLAMLLCLSINSIAQPCSFSGTKIFVSVTGTNPYTVTAHMGSYSGGAYQWVSSPIGAYYMWTNIAGAFYSTYTTPTLTSSLYLSLRVYCGSSLYDTSCVVKLPPDPCDTPKISLSKTTICPSDTITINSTVSGKCNLYQWQDSLFGDISGATTSYLKIVPPISTTKTYRLRFTCASGTTYSDWLRVAPITTCDTALVSISKSVGCTGDTIKLRGTGISPCATLQWEDSLTGVIAGAIKDSLVVIGSTTRTSYRLKSTCPLGKTSYSDWIGFTPYTCDSPIVAASAIGGCAGDTLTLVASGISPCTKLQWEDSLSGTVMPVTDSLLKIVTGTSRNAFRLKATCPSGKIYYSDWNGFTPYASCYDSVWAGDVDWNLTVNYLDLLDLGVAYGSRGFIRTGASISWIAQYAKNWPYFFPSTVNYKNADCDGNGVVNDDDTLAIYTNYSYVHSIGVIVPKHTKTTGLPDLYFDLTGITPHAGDIITVPLKFGTSSVPVPLIYGIATRIYIDGIPTISSGLDLDYGTTWIGTPKYKLDMTNSPSSNEIDGTYVRKDNNNNAGYGTIGFLTFQVPSSTPDFSMMRFNFLSAKVIDKWGNELTEYNIINDSVMVLASNGIKEKSVNANYYIYPNPSDGNITIVQSGYSSSQLKAVVFDMLGRVLSQQPISFLNNQARLKIDAPQGNYIIELKDESETTYRQRILIQ